ncbi:MAG: hypothetical protein JWR51_2847 [Devosia sp.]|uniref:hypothetical protein n=1 Tax=Devosia sp. TaxID=1871048 RepID=UPI002634E1CC|nr:hypothetical protein [Devosia sp.]MDB5529744.1 hypothetical protein [Devosia sp.]
MREAIIVAALMLAAPVWAQEAGWHYSPLPGEGDRAALGCASGSTPENYACVAVRCEDDFGVGLHLYTSRSEGDAGDWVVDIDEDAHPVSAQTDTGPYGARITGDGTALRDGLEQGAVAYLQPKSGSPLELAVIPLSGSLTAINNALAYCAPRVPKAVAEPNADAGVEQHSIKEN